ncbi:hypothetical protein HRI_004946600 [Hibiscus trionum]|uniref:Cyclin-dependent kinase inhibitor domain-containing protein n=1 Tax=Hibiscus trionum TaxID=183268 RepID=A0A9W7MS04_HIBTR|nr:hypothetical protein HRI_004946600 [Hibiscus trionum]
MEVANTRFLLSERRKSTVDSGELPELELTSPEIELGQPCFLSNSLNEAITSAATSPSSGVMLAAGGDDKCSRLCFGVSSFSRRPSNNESCGIVKDSSRFVDLEVKSFETEISTCININKFSRETSEFREDSAEMVSPETNPPPLQSKQQPITPSQAEIDEFFSVTEKYEQKRFIEKYNYDTVKDMPVDGRYQWVRLKP